MMVTMDKLPETLEEFRSMPQMDLTRPENTCAVFLCALNLYTKDKDAGLKALDLLRGPRPMNGYDKQFLRDRLMEKSYLPLAYFEGALPSNNYTPSVPYRLEVIEDTRPASGDPSYMKVFLKTAGADSPRPVKLRRKGDIWCLWEYSSILTGIRMPEKADPWA